jgi:serine/threonine protein kinase/cytochrome c-type biogenesis protein CcmH/NrfG
MTPVSRVCQKCGTEIAADAPEGRCPGCLLQTARDAAGGQVVFGRYTLVKVLGRGGMGIVWLARDEELERDVALKFLPDLMIQDRALVDQLKRETKRCLELTHPHVVRIYDFVHDERSGCISMEYVDGETLSNLRAEKEQKVFEPDEIASWISQLCDALDYAHNHAKVIHRDLKPANLMVNQRGDLKVADFGIARSLVDSASRLTAEEGRSGTLVYMSPQQLSGDRGTHLDDIYSLGATIYELLTSKPPFYSGNIDRQICERVAPAMAERRKEFNIEPASIPQIWEKSVAACLAKDPSRRPQSAVEVVHRFHLPAAQARIRATPGKTSKKAPLLVTIIAAASIIVLAGLYFGAPNRYFKPASPPPTIADKSIAVLPFENRSEEKANAYFAEGIQDEILTRLSKIADLKVISRTSTQHYKSAPENLPQIARQLGVAHILEGSVQKSGNTVRVNVQLINAANDSHVWADTFDRKLTDLFLVESEVAKAIAEQLQARFSPEEKAAIESGSVRDLVAYELYREAKNIDDAIALDSKGQEHLLEAERLLKRALSRDPDLFPAQCLLARVEDQIYFFGIDRTQSRLAQAQSAIDAARQLQPDAGETHLAVAQHMYWGYRDYDAARTELATAARRLPNSSSILELVAYIDRRQGRWDSALKSFQRALELDPLNIGLHQQIAMTNVYMRHFPEAAAALDRAVTIAPDNVTTRVYRAAIDLWQNADMAPLRSTLDAVLARDATRADQVIEHLFQLALMERNAQKAEQALTKIGPNGLAEENFPMPYALCEAMIARLRRDSAAEVDALSRAQTELNRMLDRQPTYAEALSVLGLVKAAQGDKRQAIAAGERAAELLPISKDARCGEITLENLALTYALVGEKDKAFAQLDRIMHVPGNINYGDFLLNPRWDPLRNDPRFEKLIAVFAPPRD